MNCRELYEVDDGLKAMISCWVRDRRCPLALPDYLMESELQGQAECCEWCVQMPDRGTYTKREVLSGPFPDLDETDDTLRGSVWYWFTGKDDSCDCVPSGLSKWIGVTTYETPELAILALLDSWAEALAEGADLPRFLQVGG